MIKKLLYFAIVALLVGCTNGIPENARRVDTLPDIFPDYTDVTVPPNIAPLRFQLVGSAEDAVCVLKCGDRQIIQDANNGKFLFDQDEWRELLQQSAGKSISVCLYAKSATEWIEYRTFNINVALEEIDDHLVYRLIPPGYELWLDLGIYQRDLTCFKEKEIAVNRLTDHNCMNCHSFCMQSPDRMMLHMRAEYPGTYIYDNGKLQKVAGAINDSVKSLVYPSWHPSGRFIAFSTNNIHQIFHMQHSNRIEVYDESSDVLVYDIDRHEAFSTPKLFSKSMFETFPTFSPDGRTLFFCTADSVKMPENYKEVKYSLCSIDFDPATRSFGDRVDTLYNAHAEGRSARLPRVSPDGNYLIFTISDYGNFSIWHHDADLYLYNLKTRQLSPMSAANSSDTESYHSWSSNSHWLVFSSRRVDGLYTRPFFTYIDNNGQSHKPFMLPQEDPDFYNSLMVSYNIPELVKGEVKMTPAEIADFAKKKM